MFWNKDKTTKEQSERKQNCASVTFLPRELRREIKHIRCIVDGKLYDTEKSDMIFQTRDNRLLFMTQKGNFFSCDTEYDNYIRLEADKTLEVYTIKFIDIKQETTEYAKENIGRYAPDKYIELFGEVEEA